MKWKPLNLTLCWGEWKHRKWLSFSYRKTTKTCDYSIHNPPTNTHYSYWQRSFIKNPDSSEDFVWAKQSKGGSIEWSRLHNTFSYRFHAHLIYAYFYEMNWKTKLRPNLSMMSSYSCVWPFLLKQAACPGTTCEDDNEVYLKIFHHIFQSLDCVSRVSSFNGAGVAHAHLVIDAVISRVEHQIERGSR